MDGNKSVVYTINLTPDDVNKLLAEMAALFKAAPSLRTTTPQLYGFTNMMNKLLATHDYSPQGIAAIHAEMARLQFKDNLLKDLTTVTPAEQAVPQTPAENTTVTPIKKSRKKANGSEDSGDAQV